MILYLRREFFTEKETLLAEEGEMRASAFRYSTGVEALRIANGRGWIVMLPFQGQQIWEFHFDGRDLKMKTGIAEPRATTDFLKTYGGFLYHCGLRSIGAPDAEHPQHGELPNHPYDEAWLEAGTDDAGSYMEVGGRLDYKISFTYGCRFSPRCRLYGGKATVTVGVTIENLRSAPMEYAYLCHINFRPLDGAVLIDSAPRDKEHVRVHRTIPEALPEEAKRTLGDYMTRLEEDPSAMDRVGAEGQCYLPEICFTLRYRADEEGYANTLQYLPGEGACWVRHPAALLPYGIRWISRTGDEDAMGMILPATCEHLGYRYAKEHGQMRSLPPRGTASWEIELGFLTEEETAPVREKITSLLSTARLN